jgi:translation elongation factor EF-Tu-like GTPase
MDNVSLQVNVGAVESIRGTLKFSLVVQSDGATSVHIFAFDPTDGRKTGVLLTLDEGQYRHLKDLISDTDEAISKFSSRVLPDAGSNKSIAHSFAMIVEDVFCIAGRGTVVIGRVQHGIVEIGDRLLLEAPASCTETVVRSVEKFQQSVKQACQGETVGLLLSDIGVEQAPKGTLVRSF